MKKVIAIATLVMMVMGLSVAANALSGVQFKLAPLYDAGGAYLPVTVGWLDIPTTDAKDSGWDTTLSAAQQPNAGVLEIDLVNSVVGASRVNSDYRAAANTLDVWNGSISMPYGPADDNGDPTDPVAFSCGMVAWFQTGYALPTTSDMDIYVLKGTYDANTWQAAAAGSSLIWKATKGVTANGVSAWNFVSADQNVFSAAAGENAYFTVVAAKAVPEPGSMLAMFSGLVGLVGFGIRRRK